VKKLISVLLPTQPVAVCYHSLNKIIQAGKKKKNLRENQGFISNIQIVF
jgi:hypothetical protein